jgi:hypothetical protein
MVRRGKEMDIINHQLNLFIIPFVFKAETEFDEVANSIEQMKIQKDLKEGADPSIWQPIQHNSDDRFFGHINQLVPTDGENYESTIGKLWGLNPLARDSYKLPKNQNQTVLFQTSKKKEIQLKILDVQLYLFETGIGFLIYEINYPKINNIDELVLANYLVKRFKNFGGKMQLLKAKEDTSEYEIKANLSDITIELLKPLNVTSYFEKDANFKKDPSLEKAKLAPNNALVFSTAILDKAFSTSTDYITRLKRYLFESRRVFKESYQPDESEFDLDKNDEIYKPFENSIWGISLEGASNIVFHTDNEDTNKFFSSSYIKNVKHNYFYMYILALHQRYALLNLSVQAAEIPRKIEKLIESAEEYATITKLREEIAYFDLRSSFLHVSHITHQDKVYQTMFRTLHIGDLHRKLQSEVESIASLLDIRKSAIEKTVEKHKEDRRRKNERFYVIASTIFVVISTLSSLWALFKDWWISSWAPTLFKISAIVIPIVAIIAVVYKLSDKYETPNKKEVK